MKPSLPRGSTADLPCLFCLPSAQTFCSFLSVMLWPVVTLGDIRKRPDRDPTVGVCHTANIHPVDRMLTASLIQLSGGVPDFLPQSCLIIIHLLFEGHHAVGELTQVCSGTRNSKVTSLLNSSKTGEVGAIAIIMLRTNFYRVSTAC